MIFPFNTPVKSIYTKKSSQSAQSAIFDHRYGMGKAQDPQGPGLVQLALAPQAPAAWFGRVALPKRNGDQPW